MNHKNHIILPHRHNRRKSKILTTEVIIILEGLLRVISMTIKKIICLVKNCILMI